MLLLEPGQDLGADLPEADGDVDVETALAAARPANGLAVRFPAFRDGRGFSLASMLRERGFTGRLVARGALLPDQAWRLKRVGFDAVELAPGADVDAWKRGLDAFSAVYQSAADAVTPIWALRRARGPAAPALVAPPSAELEASALNARWRDATAEDITRAALERFGDKIAVLSSFGAEAAVGLHLVARVDPATPVLFLDTGRHFQPTLEYRDRLVDRLGLSAVQVLTPGDDAGWDPHGDLWRTDPDACCDHRKVRPLAQALPAFDALITGRKRFHGGQRLRLPVVEKVGDQLRVNPLASWTPEAIDAYFEAHDLPRHPLVAGGFTSIGCWPCTQVAPVADGVRSGRWSGLDKTECGIHLPSRVAAAQTRRAS